MTRVTLDSNIYLSALVFGGKPMRLLEMAVEGEIEVAIADSIIEEVRRNLQQTFGWSAARAAEAINTISAFTTHVIPTDVIDAVPSDPDDNRVLECAVAALFSTTWFAYTCSLDTRPISERETCQPGQGSRRVTVYSAARRMAFLEGIPVLGLNADIDAIANQLLRASAVPAKARIDAIHIAVAAINRMEYLVTWNLTHIANAAIRGKIEQTRRGAGLQAPVICAPEELPEA